MATGFQTTVNLQQAAAVEGDFASTNPRRSVVSHEGTLVAGTGGVTVARFAWVDGTGKVTNAGAGVPTGFVARSGQQGSAVITTYLAETSMQILQGFEVTLHESGDFWAKQLIFPATVGQKVFASLTTGQIQTDFAGATIAGYIETAFRVSGFPAGGGGAVGELFVISL